MRDATAMSNPTPPPPPFDELPELMLSLRSFGSRRHLPNGLSAVDDEEARFFAPMLDARRAAASAITRAQVVAAFDARRIGALLDATIRAFAAERFGSRPPARRALEAELFEIVEPLRASLRELRALADSIVDSREPVREYDDWTHWLDALRATFQTADSIWPRLGAALVVIPRVELGKRRRGDSR
jgi:hypothetical protein